jgi:hypothetical protein
MQIDFHHAVTYVLARLAGFEHSEAQTIAYAAQHVDDATKDGCILFDIGAMYLHIESAHKTLDPENLSNKSNKLIWLPFHFLPGNGCQEAGREVGGSFIEKIVCRPGNLSHVASDMVENALNASHKPSALHRLGVTMHVLADTWAHQGFAGVLHDINDVKKPKEDGGSGSLEKVLAEIGDLTDFAAETVAPRVGHGRAGTLPDMPYLSWEYTNGHGQRIVRNNTEIFCEAAKEMCKVLQRFRQQEDPTTRVTGIPAADLAKIRGLFASQAEKDETKRHKAWLDAIASGVFSFGKAVISYDENDWKIKALGMGDERLECIYKPEFLQSDWKHFHDALQDHRLALLHDILPKYGICAG